MDSERSKKLLSKASLPNLEVPKFEAPPKREFRLPKEIASATPPNEPTMQDEKKATPPRAESTEFRDRTVDWFRAGDELDGNAAGYEDARRRVRLQIAITAGAFIVAVLALAYAIS